MFHARSPKHNVRECGGPATRITTDIAFETAVDIDFAGLGSKQLGRLQRGKLKSSAPFRWSGSFFGFGQAMGRMELVI